jgi:hypothetical protein
MSFEDLKPVEDEVTSEKEALEKEALEKEANKTEEEKEQQLERMREENRIQLELIVKVFCIENNLSVLNDEQVEKAFKNWEYKEYSDIFRRLINDDSFYEEFGGNLENITGEAIINAKKNFDRKKAA